MSHLLIWVLFASSKSFNEEQVALSCEIWWKLQKNYHKKVISDIWATSMVLGNILSIFRNKQVLNDVLFPCNNCSPL